MHLWLGASASKFLRWRLECLVTGSHLLTTCFRELQFSLVMPAEHPVRNHKHKADLGTDHPFAGTSVARCSLAFCQPIVQPWHQRQETSFRRVFDREVPTASNRRLNTRCRTFVPFVSVCVGVCDPLSLQQDQAVACTA